MAELDRQALEASLFIAVEKCARLYTKVQRLQAALENGDEALRVLLIKPAPKPFRAYDKQVRISARAIRESIKAALEAAEGKADG